jgi:hypothetical protein
MSLISDLYQRFSLGTEDSTFPLEDTEYLYSFLLENNISKTLETGFGYGGSAVAILHAITGMHTAIDNAQESYYKNAGLHMV